LQLSSTTPSHDSTAAHVLASAAASVSTLASASPLLLDVLPLEPPLLDVLPLEPPLLDVVLPLELLLWPLDELVPEPPLLLLDAPPPSVVSSPSASSDEQAPIPTGMTQMSAKRRRMREVIHRTYQRPNSRAIANASSRD
jgi:hypothetical protein